jgi:hypothetical protein
MRALFALFFALIAAPAWAQAEPTTLKVMSFNIWYGGDNLNLGTVARIIVDSGADIVGLQETDGNLDRLAEATGLVYADRRRNIISRYPIFDPALGERTEPGAGPYSMPSTDSDAIHALVQIAPGRVVAVANTHLTSDPYGPEAVRNGATLEDVLAIESETRVAEAEALAAGLEPVIEAGIPLFLTGDFNVPSWRDWTAASVAARPEIGFEVDWPVSRIMEGIGLVDSYRAVHPDAAIRPGLTWTPGAPAPWQPADGTHDRIDFVWGANAEPVESLLIGETGGPDVDRGYAPYPSDHRAVLTTFTLDPTPAPALIAVEPTRVAEGQTFLLRAALPEDGVWTGVVVPRDGDPATDGLAGIAGVGLSDRPTVKLSTLGLPPAAYDAVLLGEDGAEHARTRFHIVDPDMPAALTLDNDTYAPGEPITVTWTGAEGYRFDWIAVYSRPASDAYGYWGYVYTGGRVAGMTTLDAETLGELPPGDYEVRLLADDSYVAQAAAPFTVAGE